MPRPKGLPKTGGRKRGSLNKRTIAQQEQATAIVQEAKEAGLTPLGYMLRVMRDPKTDITRRDDMAKACAPYMHPKPASVEPPRLPFDRPYINMIVVARQMALILRGAEQEMQQNRVIPLLTYQAEQSETEH